ncbi:hypothetical protein TNCV_3541451 [Trichonephila clavipes]|nr:hypothetical protein TNCV_3541451 [Trichonephila clavipes]
MIGNRTGFIALCNNDEEIPSFTSYHCIIHQQSLNLELVVRCGMGSENGKSLVMVILTRTMEQNFENIVLPSVLDHNKVADTCSRQKNPGRPPTVDKPVRFTGRHFISHVTPNPMKRQPTRHCKVWGSKKDARGKKKYKEGNTILVL